MYFILTAISNKIYDICFLGMAYFTKPNDSQLQTFCSKGLHFILCVTFSLSNHVLLDICVDAISWLL